MIGDALRSLTNFLLEMVAHDMRVIANLLIDCLSAIIFVLVPFIKGLVSLFPGNPCGSLIAACSEVATALPSPDSGLLIKVLSAIAWILPMAYLVNLVGCVMITVMIYFSVAPLMRWAKLIT